jgi:putative ubiquitin-RnfH superfamily antitoxin RatB of RatAB toxin-antitoxin module
MSHKVSELQGKQVTLQKSGTTTSADTKASASTQAAKASETKTIDYSKLDADIQNNKLDVYETDFKDKDLQTNDRTLAVGKVLIMDGKTSEALNLANANQGHNQGLLQYIAELTQKSGN